MVSSVLAAHEKGHSGPKHLGGSVSNHFFYSVEKCEVDPMTFRYFYYWNGEIFLSVFTKVLKDALWGFVKDIFQIDFIF